MADFGRSTPSFVVVRVFGVVVGLLLDISVRWALIRSWEFVGGNCHGTYCRVADCASVSSVIVPVGIGDRIIDSDGKYFNTIEKVTIAYKVSIGNTTTAILCC